jgi:hypothetical protein
MDLPPLAAEAETGLLLGLFRLHLGPHLETALPHPAGELAYFLFPVICVPLPRLLLQGFLEGNHCIFQDFLKYWTHGGLLSGAPRTGVVLLQGDCHFYFSSVNYSAVQFHPLLIAPLGMLASPTLPTR